MAGSTCTGSRVAEVSRAGQPRSLTACGGACDVRAHGDQRHGARRGDREQLRGGARLLRRAAAVPRAAAGARRGRVLLLRRRPHRVRHRTRGAGACRRALPAAPRRPAPRLLPGPGAGRRRRGARAGLPPRRHDRPRARGRTVGAGLLLRALRGSRRHPAGGEPRAGQGAAGDRAERLEAVAVLRYRARTWSGGR